MTLQTASIFLFLHTLFLFSHNPSTVFGHGLPLDPFNGLIGGGHNLLPDSINRLIGGGKEDDDTKLKNYIIHVRQPAGVIPSLAQERDSLYSSLLLAATSTVSKGLAASRLVYSYGNVMSGFAARLTENELKALSKVDWFVHAYPDLVYSLQTTHSPKFLGLNRGHGLWNDSNLGEGIIIGVLDSGVFPNSPSFSDDGMPTPPSKWKGRCDFNASVCNNKLIGARSFTQASMGTAGDEPPTDESGHGTHTASTAAGNFVNHASVLGNAEGQAVGMAPRAHLAIYKVCSLYGCSAADILAALDAAVDDGVDVLSLSIGFEGVANFDEDQIAIGAFAAISKGIFVSSAAGNYGPGPRSVVNDAPWLLTVAASTIDRSIRATVKLGNGLELDGESIYEPKDFGSHQFPLVDPSTSGDPHAAYCVEGSLHGVDVRGKIVLCERGENARTDKGEVVKKAGGAGMILLNQEADGSSTNPDVHVLPVSHVAYTDAIKIKAYVSSSSNPTAAIVFKGTVTGKPWSPAVPSFSSRGPSKLSPGILKPDITGPGVNILAAWPFPIGPPSAQSSGPFFAFASGTSMATPHLSGIAALIKKAHPDWSPAAIKSAIMTTADVLDRSGKPIVDESLLPVDLFALGAGHVNPSKASDPGLVYDLKADDYIPYLCGLGYNDKQVEVVVQRPVSCSQVKKITEGELNYPSITVSLGSNAKTVLKRTVTNVGEARSTYRVAIDAPVGVLVRVKPNKLRFSKVGQKKRFRIVFRSTGGGSGTAQGQLKWVSPRHVVRSPISIIFK